MTALEQASEASASAADKRQNRQSTAVPFPKENNLQWLRLIFACQVLVMHAAESLGVSIPDFFAHFPGVPAFFFVSGFLIYSSYRNAPDRRYFENRFLRLFPGLVLVTLGAMAVVLVAHGWRDLIDHPGTYASWIVSQITLGQAYNPGLFRDVGVGAINGSLWTLTVEILFYLMVPVIVWLERRFDHTVIALTALSFIVYAAAPIFLSEPIYRDKDLYDVVELTPVAWGWMFGVGILAVKYFETISARKNYLIVAVVPLTLMMLYGQGALFGSEGNRLGLIYFCCYVAVVIFLAFATPVVKLESDLSYGVYVWHMPIINLLLVLGIAGGMPWAVGLTLIIAALSWFLVEKPALKLKRRTIHPVSSERVESKSTETMAR